MGEAGVYGWSPYGPPAAAGGLPPPPLSQRGAGRNPSDEVGR